VTSLPPTAPIQRSQPRCRVCDVVLATRVYVDDHFEPRRLGQEFCPYHYPDDLDPEDYNRWADDVGLPRPPIQRSPK
jgi:hypothetical protein